MYAASVVVLKPLSSGGGVWRLITCAHDLETHVDGARLLSRPFEAIVIVHHAQKPVDEQFKTLGELQGCYP
jgi:hypothetical protein